MGFFRRLFPKPPEPPSPIGGGEKRTVAIRKASDVAPEQFFLGYCFMNHIQHCLDEKRLCDRIFKSLPAGKRYVLVLRFRHPQYVYIQTNFKLPDYDSELKALQTLEFFANEGFFGLMAERVNVDSFLFLDKALKTEVESDLSLIDYRGLFKLIVDGPQRPRKRSGLGRPWYEILGVNALAPLDEIELEYKRRAKAAHPDNGGSTQAMAELNAAVAEARESARPEDRPWA